MSITTHTSTIRQYVKNHTKDDIAVFFEHQFVAKDAEIEKWRRHSLMVERRAHEELEKQTAEIERLKAELEHRKQCITSLKDVIEDRDRLLGENERLNKALDQAISIGRVGFVRRARGANDWYDDVNYIGNDASGIVFYASEEHPELAAELEKRKGQ